MKGTEIVFVLTVFLLTVFVLTVFLLTVFVLTVFLLTRFYCIIEFGSRMNFQEGDDLWEIAQSIYRSTPKKNLESSIFILGSRFCGKTSLILRFLDRDESANPSVALEYTYGRRTLQGGSDTQLCHIWELAGGANCNYLDMVRVPLKSCPLTALSVVLVLDLSAPQHLWRTWECVTAELKARLNEVSKLCSHSDITAIKSRISEAYSFEHPDKDLLTPLLTKFVIIGGKYDLFKELPLEQRNVICKTLRFLAHTHGASLQFFSTKSENLSSRVRSILSHLAFSNPSKPNQTVSLDPNKPILLPMGSDTLGQIGAPSFPGDHSFKPELSAPKTPFELWKKAFCAYFPQESVAMELGQNPATDIKYSESRIDAIRAKKETELDKFIRDTKEKRSNQDTKETFAFAN